MLACNRVAMDRSLAHLIEYRRAFPEGLWRFPFFVSQDCDDKGVIDLLETYKSELDVLNQPDKTDIPVPKNQDKLKGKFVVFFIAPFRK